MKKPGYVIACSHHILLAALRCVASCGTVECWKVRKCYQPLYRISQILFSFKFIIIFFCYCRMSVWAVIFLFLSPTYSYMEIPLAFSQRHSKHTFSTSCKYFNTIFSILDLRNSIVIILLFFALFVCSHPPRKYSFSHIFSASFLALGWLTDCLTGSDSTHNTNTIYSFCNGVGHIFLLHILRLTMEVM